MLIKSNLQRLSMLVLYLLPVCWLLLGCARSNSGGDAGADSDTQADGDTDSDTQSELDTSTQTSDDDDDNNDNDDDDNDDNDDGEISCVFEVTDSATGGVYGVWGSDADHIFAVGTGMIAQSSGTDWTVTGLDSNITLQHVWGSGPDDVFAAGTLWVDSRTVQGIVFHYDGQDWERMSLPTNGYLTDIFGFGPDSVYAGSVDGLLFFDGNAWTLIHTFDWPNYAISLWGTAPDNLYVIHGTGFYHFDGTTWETVQEDCDAETIWGFAPDDIYVGGTWGSVCHFDGSGWQEMTTPEDGSLHTIWGADGSHLYAGSKSMELFYDGTEWSEIVTPSPGYTNEFWGTGPDNVYAATLGGSMRFDGAQWSIDPDLALFRAMDFWVPPSEETIVSCMYDLIATKRDGKWIKQTLGTASDLHAIAGTSDSDIWVGACSGDLVHFDGKTWTKQDTVQGCVRNMFSTKDGTLYLSSAYDTPTEEGFYVTAVLYELKNGQLKELGKEPRKRISDIWASGNGTAWFVGFFDDDDEPQNVGVLISYDGQEYLDHSLTDVGDLWAIAGSADNNIIAVGNDVIVYDGTSWKKESNPSNIRFRTVLMSTDGKKTLATGSTDSSEGVASIYYRKKKEWIKADVTVKGDPDTVHHLRELRGDPGGLLYVTARFTEPFLEGYCD